MIYILPQPRSTYGEWRLSTEYSPTLKSRDYKDPVIVIEIDDEIGEPDTTKPDGRWDMQTD